MTRAALAAVAVAAVAAVVAFLVLSGSVGGGGKSGGRSGGLVVVVSFPDLEDDVRLLACSSDVVRSLAPPGVDPHSYHLSVEDYQLLRRADLVISTGHAPFEVELAEKVPASKLIVIPSLLEKLGGRILLNPNTGKENLHMPIYDPENYKLFMKYVAERLAELNPKCKSHYLAALRNVVERIDKLERSAPRLNVSAVASAPPAQYAVEWMGVRIVRLLVPEHGVPPSTSDVRAVQDLLKGGKVGLVVVICDNNGRPLGPADKRLVELAREYGVPSICVPAPYLPGSIPDKLAKVVGEVKALAAG